MKIINKATAAINIKEATFIFDFLVAVTAKTMMKTVKLLLVGGLGFLVAFF